MAQDIHTYISIVIHIYVCSITVIIMLQLTVTRMHGLVLYSSKLSWQKIFDFFNSVNAWNNFHEVVNISSFLPRVTKYSWKNFCDSIQSHKNHECFLPWKFRAIRPSSYSLDLTNKCTCPIKQVHAYTSLAYLSIVLVKTKICSF